MLTPKPALKSKIANMIEGKDKSRCATERFIDPSDAVLIYKPIPGLVIAKA